MNRKRSPLITAILLATLILAQGCATLNGEVPFRYSPSLPTGPTIGVKAAMLPAVDELSEKDRKALKGIADVGEKVTSKLLSDFRETRIFEDVLFPDDGTAPIQIRPTLKRFYWKFGLNPIAFIPLVQIVVYFGVPIATVHGNAELTIDLINSKTGAVISSYQQTAAVKTSQTLYNTKTGEMGAELADAFRTVVKEIKASITADRQKIEAALANGGAAEPMAPAEPASPSES